MRDCLRWQVARHAGGRPGRASCEFTTSKSQYDCFPGDILRDCVWVQLQTVGGDAVASQLRTARQHQHQQHQPPPPQHQHQQPARRGLAGLSTIGLGVPAPNSHSPRISPSGRTGGEIFGGRQSYQEANGSVPRVATFGSGGLAQQSSGPPPSFGAQAAAAAAAHPPGFLFRVEDALDPACDSMGVISGLVSKNDEFCIKNEQFCIKNEESCIKNEELCI